MPLFFLFLKHWLNLLKNMWISFKLSIFYQLQSFPWSIQIHEIFVVDIFACPFGEILWLLSDGLHGWICSKVCMSRTITFYSISLRTLLYWHIYDLMELNFELSGILTELCSKLYVYQCLVLSPQRSIQFLHEVFIVDIYFLWANILEYYSLNTNKS